jgi:glycosyltransferase involved in cell wall biosynthesis
MHDLLRRLMQRGIACLVLTAEADWAGEIDGVAVQPLAGNGESVRGADFVFTQLSARPAATFLATRFRTRLVVFQHMGAMGTLTAWTKPDLVVYNSEWLRAGHRGGAATVVLHPTIDIDSFKVERGDSLTIVGLSELKGVHTFWEIVRRMPERQFLAVRNVWGDQIVPDEIPHNAQVAGPLDDITSAFAQTRTLLMPSRFETYGRVGVEAAASGIPTIAHPSPGLREALGDAAIWVDRDNIEGWIAAIESLDDDTAYQERSGAAFAIADKLDPSTEIDAFLRALDVACRRP